MGPQVLSCRQYVSYWACNAVIKDRSDFTLERYTTCQDVASIYTGHDPGRTPLSAPMHTPFFPAWRPRLAPLKATLQILKAKPLPHLQALFGSWIDPTALAQTTSGPNSRRRIFPLDLTFWAFLSQILSPGSPCREAVRLVLALFCLCGDDSRADEQTGGYCEARRRFPLSRLHQIAGQTAALARRRCPSARLWWGRETKVIDGSTVTMPDTPANQKAFPQQKAQRPGCGFPIMRIVGLFSLSTGCLLSAVTGNYCIAELTLFRSLWHWLKPSDILLSDRHFSDYGTLAVLWQRCVDCVMRMNEARPKDFRKGLYLGRNDRLITWHKPRQRTRTINRGLWANLPATLTLRMIRVRCSVRGFRTRELVLVTTLLDPQKYPAAEVAELYLQRWEVELFFRHIKTVLQMEHLRCKSPAMVLKEFWMHMVAYNLIRALMVQAARRHSVSLARLSFKGSLDSVRQYSAALSRARTNRRAARLVIDLLRVLASDLVPERPNRREPRAIKRRPKPFPLLNKPRSVFREIPHQSRYRLGKSSA